MKRVLALLTVFFALTLVSTKVFATGNTSENLNTKVGRYTKYVYDKLSFKKMNKMSYAAFSAGFYGYLNMKEAGKLHGNALLTICDFSLSSNVKRMWVIDVAKKKILWNTFVSHGSGSGEEFATRFSNTHESHQSSLGFYTTGETYMGEKGYSLKLHGHDAGFNSNAFDRGVVIHGAEYVNAAYAKANNRIGRSHGCPALDYAIVNQVIDKIKGGHCLFIYHPMKSFTNKSYWLTNKIARLPQEADLADVIVPQASGWAKDVANGADSLKQRTNPKNSIVVPKKTADASNGVPASSKPVTSANGATMKPATPSKQADTKAVPTSFTPGKTTAEATKAAQVDTSRNFLIVR
jgi:hypothetical protein